MRYYFVLLNNSIFPSFILQKELAYPGIVIVSSPLPREATSQAAARQHSDRLTYISQDILEFKFIHPIAILRLIQHVIETTTSA